jgi:hypothetical protein
MRVRKMGMVERRLTGKGAELFLWEHWTAVVAALSQRLLDEGRAFCFLYTDLVNPTSNRVYQDVGYEPVCDSEEIAFE